MTITRTDGIAEVMEKAGQMLQKRSKNPSEAYKCTLIAEELATQLVEGGVLEVDVGGSIFPYIEILIRENPNPSENAKSPDRETRAPSGEDREISRSIIDHYREYITHAQRRGTDRYRIHPPERIHARIRKELNEYYEGVTDAASVKAFSAVRYVAGKHLLLTAALLFNKGIKHVFALMLAVYASRIIDAVTQYRAFLIAPVFVNVAGSAIVLTLNLVCAWIDNRWYHKIIRTIESAYRMTIVGKLENLSLSYLTTNESGMILSKLISDVTFIKLLLHEQMQIVMYVLIDVVFAIFQAAFKMPVMLVFYAVAIPMDLFLVFRAMGPIQRSKVLLRKKTEAANSSFSEMLQMAGITHAHGLQQTEKEKIYGRVEEMRQVAVEYDRKQLILNSTVYGTAQSLRILCLCLACLLVSIGHGSVGDIVLFLTLFDYLVNGIQRVLDTLPEITQGVDSLNSVNEILCVQDMEKNGTRKLLSPVQGDICFRNVAFSYNDGGVRVLEDVSFHIPAKKCAAFVGSSGAGKTTILNLVLGLYSPERGKVLIDETDVDELDKAAFRRHIAVVPQATVLFKGTLWENLVYGQNYLTTEKVLDVLKSVGLLGMVEEHPDGLDMPIMEGGINVSGGQRQRIAIARALLRDPDIILFDEATSALDEASEREVQEAIEAMVGRCTMLMVAHRLNTLRKADIVYQVENGGVHEVNLFPQ